MPASATLVRPCLEKNELTGKNLNWDEHDRLKRKHLADKLEKLVANSPGPYVIGLTSEWGSGKTVFLQCWKNALQRHKMPCVYFNAWECDHCADPLLAILGNIQQTLTDLEYIETTKLWRTLCGVMEKVITDPKVMSKLTVAGMEYAFESKIGDKVTDILEGIGAASISKFNAMQNSREQFTRTLAGIAESVKNNPKNDRSFPLFIMIDELDRCRPDYTVTLLERIKHLFHVPNVIFLLSFDGKQIFSVIEHTFGLKSDPSNEDLRQIYLSKFIDMFYKLPPPDKEDFVFNFGS